MTIFFFIDDRRRGIVNNIDDIQSAISHIFEHIDTEEPIDHALLSEIHGHVEELDELLGNFHSKMESVSSRWRRSRPFPNTVIGEKIPIKLFVPVSIDAIVDGFLIGITCALSRRGGLILGFANCLEMAFLGMAFSARVIRCTGSSLQWRLATISTPPLLMLICTGFGSLAGAAAREIPALFMSFVSFGIVALLFLVCSELLIEARESQGGKDLWWVSILIFLGVYVVLMLNLVIPN